jgi:hypothetical protein
MLTPLFSQAWQPERLYPLETTGTAGTLHAAMSAPDLSPSRDVLECARAYVRVDERVVAALPELREAIRSFQPVPGPAGESVAEWLMERALSMPQEATVRVRLSHGRVAGVYALCAAQVALSREERAQLGGVHYRTQPAILARTVHARRRLARHR